MAERNREVDEDRCITFRVGINLGDIVIDGEDILGDGVNVAARLQEIAEPGGIALSDRVHEDVRDRLDAVFADDGEHALKNIARPIRVWRWSAKAQQAGPISGHKAAVRAGADKPSIVVLPFENMSGDAEQEFFADGLSEDIITALSRFHSFDVVGRNTAFTFKGRSVDLKTVAQKLGVQYILEGSVRKAGNRVRITAQLIEGLADHHIWAERYDRELDDIFQVQDEIIEIIVATLAHKVDAEETERRIRTHDTDRDAYDCYLTGREYFFTRTRQTHYRSIALIDRAIELDPEFARAHGFRAWLKAYGCRYGWSDNSKQSLDEAMSSALKALSLDPSDYDVHWRLAVAYLHARRFDKAEGEYRKAQALNPNHAGFLISSPCPELQALPPHPSRRCPSAAAWPPTGSDRRIYTAADSSRSHSSQGSSGLPGRRGSGRRWRRGRARSALAASCGRPEISPQTAPPPWPDHGRSCGTSRPRVWGYARAG